ncbi:MAG TPA: MGMT family protein [Candidatus Dormibacteraeota bacterium]|nr:MGMT family protein [Candidatus Dormibacteraeota bacterium]
MGQWSQRVLGVSALVRPGEWTSYGDVAAAAGGSRLGARAVGRLAATNPAFANPHRVIGRGGRVPEGWGGRSAGPDDCRARLGAEGVGFRDGAADPARHVGWNVLLGRAEPQPPGLRA